MESRTFSVRKTSKGGLTDSKFAIEKDYLGVKIWIKWNRLSGVIATLILIPIAFVLFLSLLSGAFLLVIPVLLFAGVLLFLYFSLAKIFNTTEIFADPSGIRFTTGPIPLPKFFENFDVKGIRKCQNFFIERNAVSTFQITKREVRGRNIYQVFTLFALDDQGKKTVLWESISHHDIIYLAEELAEYLRLEIVSDVKMDQADLPPVKSPIKILFIGSMLVPIVISIVVGSVLFYLDKKETEKYIQENPEIVKKSDKLYGPYLGTKGQLKNVKNSG